MKRKLISVMLSVFAMLLLMGAAAVPEQQAAALLAAAKSTPMEYLITVALFTGMRISELLGLTWAAVDFQRGTITVSKQLTRVSHRAAGLFQSPKSGKHRTITPAPAVMAALRKQQARQTEAQLSWITPTGWSLPERRASR